MAVYVPRVLVCGDVEKFKKIIGDKIVEIIDIIRGGGKLSG